jgi:autotransporter passenger strand-loop-strand repeat protein
MPIIHHGETQVIQSGITENGNIVVSGGTLIISADATANNTRVETRGEVIVNADGTTNNTVLDGCTKRVHGTTNDTTVNGGGRETIDSDGMVIHGDTNDTTVDGGAERVHGTTNDTTVNSGGVETVDADGTANGTTVNSGGTQLLLPGSDAFGTTINGGKMVLEHGVFIGNEPITFTSAGGILQINDAQDFLGVIAGFGSPSGVTEEIDLRDLHFSARLQVNFADGFLSVGPQGDTIFQARLEGQFSASQFTLSPDGHGGTLITDPTLSVSTVGTIHQMPDHHG